MTDIFTNLFNGFGIALQPYYLLLITLGGIMGTIIGMLPGLGPATGVAVSIAHDLCHGAYGIINYDDRDLYGGDVWWFP
ncbi:hypothetical protein NM432_16550 [Vibrio metschnikovii]